MLTTKEKQEIDSAFGMDGIAKAIADCMVSGLFIATLIQVSQSQDEQIALSWVGATVCDAGQQLLYAATVVQRIENAITAAEESLALLQDANRGQGPILKARIALLESLKEESLDS